MDYISDLIHSFKAKYQDPFFIIAGDWNRADTYIALEDFVGIVPVLTPPTRGDETLDIIFINMSSSVVETDVAPPLIPDSGRPGRPSDHNVVIIKFKLPRCRKFKWLRYSYRKYTECGDAALGEWIMGHD